MKFFKAHAVKLGNLILIAMIMSAGTQDLIFVGSQEQSCGRELYNLQPCFPYVIRASPSSSANEACCIPLRNVTASSGGSSCLCKLEQIARSYDMDLNGMHLLELLKECNVAVPITVSGCESLAPAPESRQISFAVSSAWSNIALIQVMIICVFCVVGQYGVFQWSIKLTFYQIGSYRS
ncbi:hypothetical protein KP509_35G017500 [Ceratopteris richardii]|uniref:Bifunctional inhibitor/plant lipid transfer protein/seed storage helical domain-containing protein n=1 Tax=Ceratopteris richardii TaxID=49495 RepID=A0A8T2QF26_CERRI|nr:hypothetical protein KP509_35G017500 [Ceratopteris richardii]